MINNWVTDDFVTEELEIKIGDTVTFWHEYYGLTSGKVLAIYHKNESLLVHCDFGKFIIPWDSII